MRTITRSACKTGLVLTLLLVACVERVERERLVEHMSRIASPNIVLIVVDTLRADYTSPYGFSQPTTPELARWSEQGVLFERARAQSSWTKISMASLLTSLWPSSHGLREPRDGLHDEGITLAEVLRRAGYATYGVQTNGWLDQSFGFHQGFDRYLFPQGGGHSNMGHPAVWPHAERVYEESVRLMEAHDPRRPMFLYLHFMDVHENAAPPAFHRFGTDRRGAHLAAIHWVDEILARLYGDLHRLGLADRTLLAFTADHGETFGEHGIRGHARNVLTPVVWVPLVLRFPFPVEAVRIPSQVRLIDVAPTLLELAGLETPDAFQGRSLVPLIEGRETRDRESYAALGTPLFPDASVQTALHDVDWTYARNAPAEGSGEAYARAHQAGAEFLFHRTVDPGENVNLIDLEPQAADRYRAALQTHLDRARHPVVEADVRIDPAIARRLRAMGYLE